jgi:polyphosphate:AMP phosphotransferase
MLQECDLSLELSADEYKSEARELGYRLGGLQRRARSAGLPVMIVFEGWGASGKGTVVNELLQNLDPRGFLVNSMSPPTRAERLQPFFQRFWERTPARDQMSVFIRSWYSQAFLDRARGKLKKQAWRDRCERIQTFERQLHDDGYLTLKFFLHISRQEQKKRFKKLEKNRDTRFRVTRQDWSNHKRYDDIARHVDDMLERTQSDVAPWTVVPAHDWRHASLTIFRTVAAAVETRLDLLAADAVKPKPARMVFTPNGDADLPLARADLTLSLDRDEYNELLDSHEEKLRQLQYRAYREQLPVALVFQGWDAAGKGGAIKRLTRKMDPRGYDVIPVGAPNDLEKAHHYLWRFWKETPRPGHFAIFDRSWYGRVLVEAVEGLCSAVECERAYDEISEMERQWADAGILLLKFWLQIDPDEQLRRFEARQSDPHKQWKITDEDWRNREKWPEYERAANEMIVRTNTDSTPWIVVEGNCKLHARIKVMGTVVDALEERL